MTFKVGDVVVIKSLSDPSMIDSVNTFPEITTDMMPLFYECCVRYEICNIIYHHGADMFVIFLKGIPYMFNPNWLVYFDKDLVFERKKSMPEEWY